MAIASTDEPAPSAGSEPSNAAWHVHLVATVLGIAGIGASFAVCYFAILPACAGSNSCLVRGELFKPSTDYGLLAGVLIATLAVERLVEPFSRYLGPDTRSAKDARDEALAGLKVCDPSTVASRTAELAAKQADVDRARTITAIAVRALATCIALFFAASLKVLLLYAITAPGATPPPSWIDLLVTGLVVGAGTKPVHDLVSRLQTAKENAEDPPQTRA